jgi:hypothetical protein
MEDPERIYCYMLMQNLSENTCLAGFSTRILLSLHRTLHRIFINEHIRLSIMCTEPILYNDNQVYIADTY